MSIIQKLSEGIVNRDLKKEGAALLSKWEATGLLEGIDTNKASTIWRVFLKTKRRNFFANLTQCQIMQLKVLLQLRFQLSVAFLQV